MATSPGARTLRTIGVLSLYFRSVTAVGIVLDPQDEDGKSAFLVEILFRDGHGKNAIQSVLAVGGFVAMLVGCSR